MTRKRSVPDRRQKATLVDLSSRLRIFAALFLVFQLAFQVPASCAAQSVAQSLFVGAVPIQIAPAFAVPSLSPVSIGIGEQSLGRLGGVRPVGPEYALRTPDPLAAAIAKVLAAQSLSQDVYGGEKRELFAGASPKTRSQKAFQGKTAVVEQAAPQQSSDAALPAGAGVPAGLRTTAQRAGLRVPQAASAEQTFSAAESRGTDPEDVDALAAQFFDGETLRWGKEPAVSAADADELDRQNRMIEDEVRAFLAGQKHIRVIVTWAPGNGHQSASVRLIRRLRELGFEGLIEVVYDDETLKGEVRGKLASLLPGFDPALSVQEIETGRLSAVALSVFDPKKSPKVQIAITGATDGYLSLQGYGAEYLLRLQPFEWPFSSIIYNDLSFSGDIKVNLDEKGFFSKGFRFNMEEKRDIPAFLESQMSLSPALKAKVAGLSALLDSKAAQTRELLPVYGLITGGQSSAGNAGVLKLHSTVSALKTAVSEHPGFFSGGIVIPVFGDMTSEEKELEKTLLGSRLASGEVKTSDVEDPALPGEIERLAAGKLLIVFAGGVPQEVFEQVFSHATLPALVAGKNAINLMLSLGKPYFNTKYEFPEKFKGLFPKKLYKFFQAAHKFLPSRAYLSKGNYESRCFNGLMVLARAGHPVLKKAFELMRLKGPDKAVLGLWELMKVMGSPVPPNDAGKARPGAAADKEPGVSVLAEFGISESQAADALDRLASMMPAVPSSGGYAQFRKGAKKRGPFGRISRYR
ncbi:MAG: hypothetical protein WCU88_11600 [Elusimicrobiota bacterium]|jgi:hypothetical protein